MKSNYLYIFISIFFMCACNANQPPAKVLVAIQWVGNGYEGNDPCNSLYKEDGSLVKTPSNFVITPYKAVKIAYNNINYSCSNKLGAQIYADNQNYYITRLGDLNQAIIIHGASGVVLDNGFHHQK